MSDDIKNTGEGQSGLGIDTVVTIVLDTHDAQNKIKGEVKESVVSGFDQLLTDVTSRAQEVNNLVQNINSILTGAVNNNSKLVNRRDVQDFQLLAKKIGAITQYGFKESNDVATNLGSMSLMADTLSKLIVHATRLPDQVNPKSTKNTVRTPLLDVSVVDKLVEVKDKYNRAVTRSSEKLPGTSAVPIADVQANPSRYASLDVLNKANELDSQTNALAFAEYDRARREAQALRLKRAQAWIRKKQTARMDAAGIPQLPGMTLDMETADDKNNILSLSYGGQGNGFRIDKTLYRDVVKDNIKVSEFNKQLVGGKIPEGGVTLDEMMGTLFQDMKTMQGGDKLQAPYLFGQNLGTADFNWLMQNHAKMTPGPVKDEFGELLGKINEQRSTALKDTIKMWVDFARKELGEFGVISKTSGGAALSNIASALKIPMTAHDVTADRETTEQIARLLYSPEGMEEAKARFMSGGREAWIESAKATRLERNIRGMLPPGSQQVALMQYAENRPEFTSLDYDSYFENLIKQAESTTEVGHQKWLERINDGKKTSGVTLKSFDQDALTQAYQSLHQKSVTAIQDEISKKLINAQHGQYSTAADLDELARGIVADPKIEKLLKTIPKKYGITDEYQSKFSSSVGEKLVGSITSVMELGGDHESVKALSGTQDQRLGAIREMVYNNIMTAVGGLSEAGIPEAKQAVKGLQYYEPGTLRATFLGGNAVGRPEHDTEHLKEIYNEGGYMPSISADAGKMGDRFERLLIPYLQEQHGDKMTIGFTGEKQQLVKYGQATGHPDMFGYDIERDFPFIGEAKYTNPEKLSKIKQNGILPEWETQTNHYAMATGLGEDAVMKYFLGNLTSDTPEIRKIKDKLERGVNMSKRTSDLLQIDLEKLQAARVKEMEAARVDAEKALSEGKMTQKEFDSGSWADRFWSIDELHVVEKPANKKLQDQISNTIKEITGVEPQPEGLNKAVQEFYKQEHAVESSTSDVLNDLKERAKQVQKTIKTTAPVLLKKAGVLEKTEKEITIESKTPPPPTQPPAGGGGDDGGTGGTGGGGDRPPQGPMGPATMESARSKFEYDLEILKKLRDKAKVDLTKAAKQQQLFRDASAANDTATLEIFNNQGLYQDVLEEKTKYQQALLNGYERQIAGTELHLENNLQNTDYTSQKALGYSQYKAELQNRLAKESQVQALKDKALQLAGVNQAAPTATSMAEADAVAVKLQELGVKAGHSRLDLFKLNAPFKEAIGLPDATKALTSTESLQNFTGEPTGMKSQLDLFNKANQAVKTLWSQLHTAQGETFLDQAAKKLQSFGKLIQEDIVKIDQLADRERRINEEIQRLTYKRDRSSEDKETLEAYKAELNSVRTQKAELTESSKSWIKEAQNVADEQRPVKDYSSLSSAERDRLEKDLQERQEAELEKLQMRKAELETEIGSLGAGMTHGSYQELGGINDELRRRGVSQYGLRNSQLSDMASHRGWAPLPEYTEKADERAPKVFNQEIEVRLATRKAMLDFNDLKVELQKQAVAVQVDIQQNGMNEENLKKALQNSSLMATHGLAGTAGYTTAQLLDRAMGQGISPFGNDIKGDSAYINTERLVRMREHYTKELTGGMEYIETQKANLSKSVDDMYSALESSGRSKDYTRMEHTDELMRLEKDAYKAINDLADLRDTREKLLQEADAMEKEGHPGANDRLREANYYNTEISKAETHAASKVDTYDKAVKQERARFSIQEKEVQDRIVAGMQREAQEERELLELEKFRLEYKLKNNQLSLQEAQRLVAMQKDLRRVGLQPTGDEEAVVSQAKKSGFSKMDIQPGRKGNTFVEGAIGLLDWQMQWLSGVAVLGAFSFAVQNSLGFAKQFEAELKNIQLITQANTADMSQLVGGIVGLTNKYQYSASELGQALVILGQAGFKASESMKLLPNIATLATATMSTLAVAADITTTSIEAFNVPVEKSTELANTLAAMTIESKLDLEKLGTTFNYVAETASAAGVSVEEIGTAMGLMSNSGVRASTIGTSLRSVLGSLMNPTEKFRAQLSSVGLSMDDVNPRFNSLGTIFQRLRESGFSVQDAFEGLDKRIAGSVVTLVNVSDQWNEFQTKITGTNRALDMAAGQMDTFEAQSKRLHNNLQLALGGIGMPMLEPLKQGTAGLATIVGWLERAVKTVPGGFWQAIGLVGGITSAASISKAAIGGVADVASSIRAKQEGLPITTYDLMGSSSQNLQKVPLTGMERTLATTLTTLFDPKLLGIGVGITAVIMGLGAAIDWASGDMKLRNVTKMADALQSESEQITRQIKLYKEAAYGTQMWADARKHLQDLGMRKLGQGENWSEDELKAYDARARELARDAKSLKLPAQMDQANSTMTRFKMWFRSQSEVEEDAKVRAGQLMEGLKNQGMAYSTDESYVSDFLSKNNMGDMNDATQARIRDEFYKLREGLLNSPDQARNRLSESKTALRNLYKELEDNITRYSGGVNDSAYLADLKTEKARQAQDMGEAPDFSEFNEAEFRKQWLARKGARKGELTAKMRAQLPDIQAYEGADEGVFTGTQLSINKRIDDWAKELSDKRATIATLQAEIAKGINVDVNTQLIAGFKKDIDELERRAVALNKEQVITTLLPKVARYQASMIKDLATVIHNEGGLVSEVGAAGFDDYQKKIKEIEDRRLKTLSSPMAQDPRNAELVRTIQLSFNLEEKELTEAEVQKAVQKIEAHMDKYRAAIRNIIEVNTSRYSEDFETFKTNRSAEAEMQITQADMKPGSYMMVPSKYTGSDKTNNLPWLPPLSEAEREQIKLEADQDVFRQKMIMQERVYQEKRANIVREFEEKIRMSDQENGAGTEVGEQRKLEIKKKYGDEVSALDKTRRDEIRQNIDYEVQQYQRVAKAIQDAHKATEDRVASMDKLISKLDEAAGKDKGPQSNAETVENNVTRLGHEMLEAQRKGDTVTANRYYEEMTTEANKALEFGPKTAENVSNTLTKFRDWTQEADAEYKTRRTANELEPRDDIYNRLKTILQADDLARQGGDQNDYSLMAEGKRIRLKELPNRPDMAGARDGLGLMQKPLLTDLERKQIEAQIASYEQGRAGETLEANKSMGNVAKGTMDTVYEQVQKNFIYLVNDMNSFGEAMVAATKRLNDIAQQNEKAKDKEDKEAADRETRRNGGSPEMRDALDKRMLSVKVEPSPMFITTVKDEITRDILGLGG